MGGNEGVSGLLKSHIAVEFAEVIERVDSQSLVNCNGGQLSQPWVKKALLSGRTLVRAVGKEGSDEALGVLRDGLPDAVLERELALTNLLHDILVGLTVEGRHSGEEDVDDDTAGPDITLLVIALVKNLGGDVVGSSELLVKVTVGIVDKGGSEIDNLNLIELLVLLEKNVLGLQVTMDDVGLVAVVDAGEDLLHENSGISLAEFAALENFVEELATLADFGNKVVTLLIFEELVHLDDVGVILYSQTHRFS